MYVARPCMCKGLKNMISKPHRKMRLCHFKRGHLAFGKIWILVSRIGLMLLMGNKKEGLKLAIMGGMVM